MNHDRYSDDYLRGIFARVKTIAMASACATPAPTTGRATAVQMRFLQS